MEIDHNSLPSEKLQKEFENNPLKILENIRNEKEDNFGQEEIIKEEITKSENSSLNEKHILFNKEKLEIDSTIPKDNYNTFTLSINEKNTQKDINKKKNHKKDVDYIINNRYVNSNNSSFLCNSELNYENNNNITVNNLSIFFNFNNINSDYINNNKTDNFVNINNNICNICGNEEINSTSFQSNTNDDKTNNESKLLVLFNINIILENLKSFKGSIICQEFIDKINNEKDITILFNNIMPHICTIMCLEYGNYFYQKLLKKLNLEQKLIIYQIIEPNFLDIASNKFGTHSIQSLINNIQTEYELLALNNLISKNMYFLFVDKNAYHIMMKIILDFPENKRNVLNMFLITNVEKIIINCNGSFCINKFIVYNKDLSLRELLIKNIEKNIKDLIYNKYSCINLLLILEKFGINWGNFIIKEIQENFGVLCEHPVSNIFINKVLIFLNNNYSYELKVLLWSLYKNIVLMKRIISNKNNNRLINQLINLSDDEQKKYIFLLLNNNGNL